LQEHADLLKTAEDNFKASIAEIMKSRSWRLTAPLRALARAVGISG
jgi:hypothetical protein